MIKIFIMKRIILIITVFLLFFTTVAFSQSSTTGASIVSSAVPFASIAPDSRGGGMGDLGVATSPDINAQFWNPAKYVFNESKTGIALSYTPWLANLVPDMNLAYLVGYHQLDDIQALSGSLRYFDLGSMQLFDEGGIDQGQSHPNEFTVDFGYSRKLSETWAGSVALRFILSDIYNGIPTTDLSAGTSYAADVAFLYRKDIYKNRKNSNISAGINISNIGSKISYTGGINRDFIPTNLRIGGAYTYELDKYNKLSFGLDFNKLLVPSPQIDTTETGVLVFSNLGNQDVGPIEGIFISFYDAPGGFMEELSEVTISVGAEYWYSNQFAVRMGYFFEPEEKGDRKFLTFGAGLRMNVFSLDFSYIVAKKASPLEGTLRFTLGFDLDDFNKQDNRRRRR
ncbi:MAG: type IX secretion system outer membrane channel protein PorV [Prolixibacteraceae bacterium]|nr:type IX secretion system outer membrane channel protein PorV [Prolixibacteraceae bacterium]